MEALRVPKHRVKAQLVLLGGETREVLVFLAEATPERTGGERLSDYVMPEGRSRLTDYFNQAQPFLRLVQDSQVALVNKLHVAYVETLSR